MASSITIPVANDSANRVMLFSVKPNTFITAKVPIRDTGIAVAAIIVLRKFRKNRNTTRAAKRLPRMR